MAEQLKPCPFCGSNEIQLYICPSEVKTEYVVYCLGCGASSMYADKEKDAVFAWNRRAGE